MALVAGLARPAAAEFVLSEVILDFKAGGPVLRDVEIRNTGSDTLYVQTSVTRITNPGEYPVRKETSTDPSALGLVVSPNRFILNQGDTRLIRFVLTQPPGAVERIYRVGVTPVSNEVESPQSGIKIMVAYEMLVIVRPTDPVVRLEAYRDGKKLVARNIGNTNVLLAQIEQCKSEDDCVLVSGNRVYPGKSMTIDLPLNVPVKVYHTAGEQSWVKVY